MEFTFNKENINLCNGNKFRRPDYFTSPRQILEGDKKETSKQDKDIRVSGINADYWNRIGTALSFWAR